MSELEQDFDKAAEEINAKLAEAAKALKEAVRLAGQAGFPGLIFTQFTKEDLEWQNRNSDNPIPEEELDEKIEDLEALMQKIDVSEIESAIESGGWQTSSAYC